MKGEKMFLPVLSLYASAGAQMGEKMKKKHILFDVDGTLLDSKESVLCSLQEALREYTEKEWDTEELKFALGIPGREALRQMGFPDEEVGALLRRWEDLTEKYRSRLRLFPGLRRELSLLKEQGCALGIVTSRTRQEYRKEVSAFGLDGFFDEIICMEDTKRHKPAGDPVREYLRRTGASPEETVYIGDTVYDMCCAHDAGVEGALALWGCVSARHIRADYYLTQPAAITETFCMPKDSDTERMWLKWAARLQFIAQAGLTYSENAFDRERFAAIRETAAEIMSVNTPETFERIDGLFSGECGYQTPKLDTRAAVFEGDRILLVQEADGRWALPGGWVDADKTIYENTIKETKEEAGVMVAPVRLIALQEQTKRNRPANFFHICKVFVLCEPVEGKFEQNTETVASGWFTLQELPVLAEEKTTRKQVELCFAARADENWITLFD